MYTADWLDTIKDLQHRAPKVGEVEVSFTRNAKGEVQPSVKVSAPVATPLEDLQRTAWDVFNVATELFSTVDSQYPYGGE